MAGLTTGVPSGAPSGVPSGVAVDVVSVQRRTVSTLVASQAVGALGMSIGIATASLLARDLSGSDTMAGLAQTFQVLGTAAASWLLARMMSRRGRRIGLVTGYLAGGLGAALAVVSGVVGSIVLMLVGMALLGATTSASYASRYAATDLAADAHRGRALSTVVWATTIGAVVGPNLTGPSAALADWLGIPELTGPFALAAVGMALAALVVSVRLRPDPLLLARSEALAATPLEDRPPATAAKPSVRLILRERPAITAAIAGLAAAHAVMVSVMVMTPLHMEHGGSELRVIGFVISVHVLGMFAFSPLVGMAADRFGRPPVLAVGGVVLLVSLVLCALAPEGNSTQIFAGLFLLGLGWSIATVAGATIVAEQAPLEGRAEVQGLADLSMSLAGGLGGAASGLIVHHLGFGALAGYSSLFAVAVLVAAVVSGRRAVPAT